MQESSDTTYANRKMTLKMEHIAVVFNERRLPRKKGECSYQQKGKLELLRLIRK